MFCSATPAFTYCVGKRSMKSVRTPKPRSPLTSMMRSSSAASSPRARTKASRMACGRDIDAKLAHRGDIFLALRRAVMPEHLVLHEGYAAALHGVGNNAGRAVAGRIAKGGP